MSDIATAYVQIVPTAKGIQSAIETAVGDAGKSSGKNLGSALVSGIKTTGAAITAATTVATSAIVGMSASAIKVGSEFDSAMSQVAATLGMTTEDIANNVDGAGDIFEALKDKAEEAGRSTIFSASESAEGLNILAMSGYDASESIAMLDDVLHLAAAGSMDMASAAGYVSGTMKGFNDETKDSGYYADLMAKGATLANTNVQQLGEAMSSGAAGAAAYSQNAESMTIALLRLAEQGEVGSAAGTALAAAMKNLYTPTDQAKKALEELGVSAFDASTGNARDFNDIVNELSAALENYTEEEQAAYKQTIFGIQGLDAFNKMTVTAVDKQNEWADALQNAKGEAEKQYDTMTDNLEGDIAGWNSALDGFKIAIADGLMPTIREFVQFGTEGLSQITDAFKEGGLSGAMEAFGTILSDGLNMVIEQLPEMVNAGMQLLEALIGGILDNADKILEAGIKIVEMVGTAIFDNLPKLITAGFEIIMKLADSLTENLPELIPAIVDVILQIIETLTNPDTLVQLVDAALQIIIALAEGIIAAIPKLIEKAPTIIMNLVTALIKAAPMLLQAGAQLIGTLVSGLVNSLGKIKEAGGKLKDTLTEMFAGSDLGKKIINQAGEVKDGIAGVFSNAKENIQSKWDEIALSYEEGGGGLAGATEVVFDQIANKVRDGFDFIGNVFGVDMSEISDNFTSAWFNIRNIAVDSITEAKEKIVSIWNSVVDAFKPLLDSLKYLFDTIFKAIQTLVERALTAVSDKFTEIWNGIINFLNPIFESMYQFISDVLAKIQQVFSDIWNGIKNFLSNILNSAKNEVSQNFQQMYNLTKEPLNKIKSTVESVFNNIKNTIKGIVDKAKTWGADMLENFIDGIKSKIQKVADTVTGVADKIQNIVGFSEPKEGPLSNFHTFAPDMMELFAEGIYDNISMIGNAMNALSGDIRNQFANPVLSDLMVSGKGVSTAQVKETSYQGSAPAWGGSITIPVYIGQKRIETFVIDAINSNNYKSGGH